MSNELQDQLRAIVDIAAPISAEEAIARAEAYPTALRDHAVSRGHQQLRLIGVAAAVVVLAGAGVGWAVAASSRTPMITRGPAAIPKYHPKMILTAAEVRAIASHSTAAAASSGLAQVHESTAIDGAAQNSEEIAVTFSGQNIDEQITTTPEPAASAKPFKTDDRFVDGQFYIYTPGPGDVLEWLHDTNSANDAASMQFPDPRSLYNAISPDAQFTTEGTTTMNGETVTHLIANHPSAIDTTALGNFATGRTLTSFELWVDTNEVVQQITLTTSQTNQSCQLNPLPAAELKKLAQKYDDKVPMSAIRQASSGSCGPQNWTTTATVAFADLGVPQSVTAPANPVTYAGKG